MTIVPQKPRPVVVSGFSSQILAQDIADELGSRVIEVSRRQFADKEIQTTIEENVRGRDVVVVASAAGDPNKQEKETRLLMRASQRAGAKSVTLVLPYMWYGRSDDNWDERNAPALSDTIETLREHCDSVVIADPHNHGLTREKFLDSGGPVRACQPLHFAFLFAVQLKRLIADGALKADGLLLSHADAGSTKRISRSFRKCLYGVLGLDRNPDQDDWAQGLKDRDKAAGKIVVKGFSADVAGRDVVIFEDMVASGSTACDTAALLKRQGARSVITFATSGLFTPPTDGPITAAIDRLNESAMDAVFVTDTYDHRLVDPAIHEAIEASPVVHVLRAAPYLATVVDALLADVADEEATDENSISALLRGDHPRQRGEDQTIAAPAPLKPGSPLLKTEAPRAPARRSRRASAKRA